jgi:Short C-terminal domain
MSISQNALNLGALLIVTFAVGGCTAVRVQPVSAEHKISHICINDNARVQVGDFVDVMQEGFQKHGITSQVITGTPPSGCAFTSNYTARRAWDLAMYMTDAQIDILQDGHQIASANYHLKGGGGLALNKWDNTRTKILPVIDKLLGQLTPASTIVMTTNDAKSTVESSQVPSRPADPVSPSELSRKLSNLKDAFDAGLITREEYDAKRKELIANL